jgi:hypothetical protein
MLDQREFRNDPHEEAIFSLVPDADFLLDHPSIRHRVTNVYDPDRKTTRLGLNFKWSDIEQEDIEQGEPTLLSIGRKGCTINCSEFDSSTQQCAIEFRNDQIVLRDHSDQRTTRAVTPSRAFFEDKLTSRTVVLHPEVKFVFAVGCRHLSVEFTIVWHVMSYQALLPPNHSPTDAYSLTSDRDAFRKTELALCSRDVGRKWVALGMLGKGAFGTVRRAVTLHTTRIVAVKEYYLPGETLAQKDSRRKERGVLQEISHVSCSCTYIGA